MIGHGAAKRHRQSQKARLQNRWLQKRARTMLLGIRKQIASGNMESVEEHTRLFCSYIDRAAKKGGVHRNTASRLKSRLHRAVARAMRKDDA